MEKKKINDGSDDLDELYLGSAMGGGNSAFEFSSHSNEIDR